MHHLLEQQNLGRRVGTSKIHLSPLVTLAAVRSKAAVVVDSLLIVTPIAGFCNCSMICCALLCVHSSFAIISMGKRELVTLLCLSSWCLVDVVWLFLAIPRVCLQLVIVVFPDHNHFLFLVCGMWLWHFLVIIICFLYMKQLFLTIFFCLYVNRILHITFFHPEGKINTMIILRQ